MTDQQIKQLVEKFRKDFCTTVGDDEIVVMQWLKKDTPLPKLTKWFKDNIKTVV